MDDRQIDWFAENCCAVLTLVLKAHILLLTRPTPLQKCTGGFSICGIKMSTYNKPHLTFKDQLEQLKCRGLEVTDDIAAVNYLRRVGYYRLSGYLYPFRKQVHRPNNPSSPKREDGFVPETKFLDAVNLYIFDKKLRLLILDAIERIEVAIRVDIAYLLGAKNTFAQTVPDLLHGNFTKKINPKTGKTKYQDWLFKEEQLVNRSKEDFVQHYKNKYGLPLPIWVSIELWDFGLLSMFYHGMAVNDKDNIAIKYGISEWQVMESWLRCLNYIRNIVAHHSRLWNKNLIDQPKPPKQGEIPLFDHMVGKKNATSRVYVALCIIIHFMQYICPKSKWKDRLRALINQFPDTPFTKIGDMGFPEEWEQQMFYTKTNQSKNTQAAVTP
jgi:abortive infection bacteriophage resistance protein